MGVMTKPLILITNDDGFASPHLGQLANALQDDAEVVVVAPERQRSAASHAITLHKPLRLHEVSAGRYSLSGTPVDCVYVGVLKIAKRKPDLVLSGINEGYNLGSDVFYSGTVAGAIEGGLRGAVGIALSMAPRAPDPMSAVRVCVKVVQAALKAKLDPGTVLNVNAPGTGVDKTVWTRLGARRYEDDVAERIDPRGRPYYWVGGGATGHTDVPGTDCNAVADGLTSITPLHLDLTAHARVDAPWFAVW